MRLRRAPSPRGYSYHMQYRTFISHPARYVAYERGKDLSASLETTIRSGALHSWHTGRYVEGCLFEAHLSCAFGAPLLQGATRIICNTVLSFLSPLVTSHTSAAKISRLRSKRRYGVALCTVAILTAARGYSYGMQYREHRSFQNSQHFYSMMRRIKTLNPST